MTLLSPEDAKAVAEQFEANLQRPVKLVVSTSEQNCMYCTEVLSLREELADLSPNLSVAFMAFPAAMNSCLYLMPSTQLAPIKSN